MRVLKETVEVSNGQSSAKLTAGLREDEIKSFAPWALERGVIRAKSWTKVKDTQVEEGSDG